MTTTGFRDHIRSAIADQQLQVALDANAVRRGSGREAALASLPDWRDRRDRAHRIRAEVMERWHELLAAFMEHAAKNGMQVHRAVDAEHALRLVLEIAEAVRGAEGRAIASRGLLFAKSKSMVSEEIEFNKRLEAAGHRVVETDLGEYIVQLRGEKPAHIITPAVHLQRHQVGELFRDALGMPYTEDIATLTAAARRVLREIFLTADIGVSGVNFGIAETGGICIVTNEGNGRMVTTVPRVHIALMGLERLVPTLDDLALMLSLLPRSATGQKLSVYTQLIHSPRREGEEDGALERHLIIVDNGRTRLWDSELREALYCIRCGACLNACPVFREIGGHAYVAADGAPAPYPGPIGSIVSPGLEGLHVFGHLAQASSLCGACKDACPVDIDLPRLLTRVRAGAPEPKAGEAAIGLSGAVRLALKAYTQIAASPGVFRLMQGLGAVGGRLVGSPTGWMPMPAFTGWGLSRDLPRPASQPFRDRWDRLSGNSQTLEEAGKRSSRSGSHDGDPTTAEQIPARTGEAVQRFVAELEALGGQPLRVRSEGLLPKLREFLLERSIHRVLAWDSIGGVDKSQLASAGIEVVTKPDAGLMAGLTGCSAAIAETGTLVVCSARGQVLSASLLPELHIAVLPAREIVWTLEEALQGHPVREAAATVLISGPSRTADIEMTLTIGVHGPKELVVFIVE